MNGGEANRARLARLAFALALVLGAWLALAGAPARADVVHAFEGSFNGAEAPGGPFQSVMGAASDASAGASRGDVYIAVSNISEEAASVVDKFHEDGSYAGVQITGAETPQGSFSFVNLSTHLLSGVAVDNSGSANKGNLYVADVAHGVVDRFSESGHYVCQITGSAVPSVSECNGAKGSATPAGSLEPTGVAVDPASGDVYVADGAHNVIDVFGPTGTYLEQIVDPHITAAAAIAIDSSDNLYVTNFSFGGEPSSRSVVKFNAKHEFVAVLDSSRPTAVAVDPVSGRVDVYEETEPQAQIAEYDSSGNLVERFGAGHFERLEAFALSVGPSERIYAGPFSFEARAVGIFGPPVVVPNVSTAPATNVQQTSATLNGQVDPDAAHGGGAVTECTFEYGTSVSYGETAPCSPAAPYLAATDVGANVNGLLPDTLYHFRVEAANADAVHNHGEDETFTTLGPPAVLTESATAGVTSATLRAQINPFGFGTTCEAQYVDEAGFDSSGYANAATVPCVPEDLGFAIGARTAIAALNGLQLGTTYHYRFIASSGAGVAMGEDRTFATFGVTAFSFEPADQEGHAYAQAGGHPYALTDSFALSTSPNPEIGETDADANLRDIRTELPPGLIGNPNAVPKCAPYNVAHADCPGASQVGVLTVYTSREPTGGGKKPIYNLIPPKGLAAQLGARFNNFVTVHIDARVRTGGDYGVTAEVLSSSAAESVTGATVTLWGVPAEASHDSERGCPQPEQVNEEPPCSSDAPPVPFLTNPTSCLGPQTTRMSADSWQDIGGFVQAGSEMPGFTGCERLSFTPSISVRPETSTADSPTGLAVDLHIPQNENPTGLAEADLKDAVVALPQGVTVNPSSANGLQACSPAQIELNGPQPARCPEPSKIGSVEIDTPLVDHPLDGGVYVAQQGNDGPAQGANPFGSLLAIYIAVYDPETGVVVKLAGEVKADPATGQLTTSFLNNPQLPFEDLKLDIFGGPRSPLATPAACGNYTTTTSLTPWSAPESGPPATPSSSFAITSGVNGGSCPAGSLPFSPSLMAGSTNIQADAFVPFATTVSREDGNQNLSVVQLHLPVGLLGKLASVTPCAEPLASLGTCGPESEIGQTTVSVGLGPNPYTISGGRVFITGPYKGAPFGLSIAAPAKAGPFDLGSGPCDCVVVRAKVEIDPYTSALTVTSDSLPTMLDGIPLQLKHINVTIDRPGFTFNPTNCSKLVITGTITGEQGASTPASVPFEVANCATLPFKPSLSASTQAKTSKVDGASLVVKVTQKPGEANIHTVDLQLPLVLPTRDSTLNKACTEAQFNANPAGCPSGSVIGTATAHTPVLQVPLTGPAYLVSHGGAAFPDVEYVLQADERGGDVEIVLDGKTQIKKGITYSHFETVPDAPISSFETDLPEGPHSIFSTERPGVTNLCALSLLMPTTIVGQNGAQVTQSTKIAVSGCRPVTISNRRLSGRSVTLAFNLTTKGTVTVTAPGLKRYRKTLGTGSQRIKVALSNAGLSMRAHHTKIKIKVALRSGRKASSATTMLAL
jgi:hypothetical protein